MSVLAKAATGAACAVLGLLLLVAASASALFSMLAGGLIGPSSAAQAPALYSGSTTVRCTVSGGIRGASFGLDPAQAGDAAVIARVARADGLPAQAIVIALATALQESGLRNLAYGDRDSLGLFQQRPSQGWGSPAEILNPSYAAQQFYSHLTRVPDWWSMPLWKAAQAVQRSANPTAYEKWQLEASAIQEFLGSHPQLCSLS